ncbi:uncharacterized protein LOC132748180 isoform X2 [Ruditapes philippinarum]|nr:uncharacterized protein LOC132748180 isoform X2 [Ruditapes philippinarum]XP_060593723.1 uncharacterized protein LOC132748180 isoform X2 [Ruditapes philippinarum]
MSRRRASEGSAMASSIKSTKKKSKKQTSSQGPFSVRVIVISSCVLTIALVIYEIRLELLSLIGLDLAVNKNLTYDSSGDVLSNNGGWRLADDQTVISFSSDICNIERKSADELTESDFETNYRYKKPLLVTFKNGAKDWTNPEKWTVESLKQEYGKWTVLSGNARDIVRRGGSGYIDTSFSEYVDRIMTANDNTKEPSYVFDREFYNDSSLPSTIKPPSYFKIKDGIDDSIFFLGSSGSGVSFHKHADTWNGVVFGQKRWFLYMIDKTPPGGVYPGYTQIEWYKEIYPQLSPEEKPLECIQKAGEILYLPESTYHGTINLGDTIAIGIQKKEAVTTVEKLFYDERKIEESMRGKDETEKQKLKLQQVKIVEKLVQLLPDNAEVQMKLGSQYADIREYEKARHHTRQAIKLDKHFVIAVLNLAGMEFKIGNLEEADQLYRHAKEMNPNLWDVYAQYGDFLVNSGRARDAVHIYRKGTELEPDTLPFWQQLRYAQQISGDSEGAKETGKVIDKMRKKPR